MRSVSISPAQHLDLGSVVVPGSKSHTIRALFIAAGAHGQSTLLGGLESDDTRSALRVLSQIGASIEVEGGVWQVAGDSGQFSVASESLDSGESGLTARNLIATAALIDGESTIVGRGRLPFRPMKGVLDAVAAQGAKVDVEYPWRITGHGWIPGGVLEVSGMESSQMISAMLMTAPHARSSTTIRPTDVTGSAGYLEMTVGVMKHFGAEVTPEAESYVVRATGYRASSYSIPPDASAAVYPFMAAALSGAEVTVPGDFAGQPDRLVLDILEQMGCDISVSLAGTHVIGPQRLSGIDVDMSRSPDAAVAAAVACVTASTPSRIGGLGSLRVKESDRLEALRQELVKFGAEVLIDEDSVRIFPGSARPARFESHNDHRIVMSLALLGLVQEGIEILDPGVVNKTWPEYWDWLARTGARIG